MTWKSKYLELKTWTKFLHTQVTIIDRDYNGFMFKSTRKNQGIIFVKPGLTYKSKIMALAHEFGHFAKFSERDGLIEKAVGAYAKESDAHGTAMEICTHFGIGPNEYIELATGRRKR